MLTELATVHGVRSALTVDVTAGPVPAPPVLLTITSTGYRLIQHHRKVPRRPGEGTAGGGDAGLAPFLVVLTVGLLGSDSV